MMIDFLFVVKSVCNFLVIGLVLLAVKSVLSGFARDGLATLSPVRVFYLMTVLILTAALSMEYILGLGPVFITLPVL